VFVSPVVFLFSIIGIYHHPSNLPDRILSFPVSPVQKQPHLLYLFICLVFIGAFSIGSHRKGHHDLAIRIPAICPLPFHQESDWDRYIQPAIYTYIPIHLAVRPSLPVPVRNSILFHYC
jgi:hypothetical protein